MKRLIKIDRLAAWVLLIGIIIYFVTGFGMVKGFINSDLSTKLHLSYLTYIVAIAFVTHTAFAISMAMRRWGWWSAQGKVGLALVYIILFSLLIYATTYQRPVPKALNAVSVTDNTVTSQTSVTPTPQTNEKIFNASELAKYNGKNGNPAYVAVDGVVYDLTPVFRNGNHYGYLAGLDLSAAFHAQHNTNLLQQFSVVGKFLP